MIETKEYDRYHQKICEGDSFCASQYYGTGRYDAKYVVEIPTRSDSIPSAHPQKRQDLYRRDTST
jgi:hypothetical protein